MSEVVMLPPPPRHPCRSRAATRERWLDRLARFPASGLTVAQFCALESISVPSFYSWKRRLAAANTLPEPAADRPLPLLPIRLPPAGSLVEVVLTTGTVLRLGPGCDLAWIRSLVTALGEPTC
jgi:hypothetical protein